MLSDPLLIALVARVGAVVTISEDELIAASHVKVEGSRSPSGDITLRLVT